MPACLWACGGCFAQKQKPKASKGDMSPLSGKRAIDVSSCMLRDERQAPGRLGPACSSSPTPFLEGRAACLFFLPGWHDH
eukprot:363076-Pelagomonas_calceolata.AAC.2